MRVLVTGASGMLGHHLAGLAAEQHDAWGSYGSCPVSIPGAQTFPLDLTDERQVKEQVGGLKPDAIVHSAALTDVDECERDPSRAKLVNTHAAENLAALARQLGARFVYISTDYVFDGGRGDYTEADFPRPINVYGQTKFLGEEAVRRVYPEAMVIRTSIFGFNIRPKTGLVEYIIQSLTRGESIRRFADQFSTPIYTADLSRLVLKLLEREASGLFHVGAREKVSRYAFARKVAEAFSLPQEIIRSVPFQSLPGMAKRPRDSSLCGKKIEAQLGIGLPNVEQGLARFRVDFARYQAKGEAK